MRNACLALVLLNVLFLAWAQWIDTPREPDTSDSIARLPRLQLVSEVPHDSTASADAGSAHRTALLSRRAMACYSIGPLADLTRAARIAGMLHERGITSRQRTEDGETSEGFWVHIDSVQGAAEASRVMTDLEHHGIDDARRMAEGDRISVGLFSERSRAERRAKAVQKLGYNPQVTERSLPGIVYWLDVTVEGEAQPLQGVAWNDTHTQATVRRCPQAPAQQAEDSVPGDEIPDFSASLPRTTVASAPARR
ncbi:MAG TPA: hypothetical protein VJQ47_04040 [Steroidobacteraceae bacterium]|nr:hypothetical protein [Steroidobacteraceae bacterium]